LFAGIDLSGSEIERDGDSTTAMYGKDFSNAAVLTGRVRVPAAAHAFIAEVRHSQLEAKEHSW